MNILILGGTYFIGRRLVEIMRDGNFNITLLNRGTKGDLWPDIETISA